MKIVVIGGSGFIGSKLVPRLRQRGHDAVAAFPNSGVNSVTGEGLAEVLKGASMVVDQATQFFEFLKGIAHFSMHGDKVHLPPVLFQPMAADDVASAVGKIAPSAPVNGTVEIAGPELFRLDELVRRRLAQLNDHLEVITDSQARYAGALLSERTLVPGKDARLAERIFETWLTQPAAKTAAVAH